MRIICDYKFKKNIIEINNKYPTDRLKGLTHVRIPYSETNKCEYLKSYTINPVPDGKIMIGRSGSHNDGYYYGYLNYIEKEKLLYQDSLIIYLKGYSEPDYFQTRGWADGIVFTNENNAVDSTANKQILKKTVLNESLLKKIVNGK